MGRFYNGSRRLGRVLRHNGVGVCGRAGRSMRLGEGESVLCHCRLCRVESLVIFLQSVATLYAFTLGELFTLHWFSVT